MRSVKLSTLRGIAEKKTHENNNGQENKSREKEAFVPLPTSKCYSAAMRLLEYGDRSAKELFEKLAQKGFEQSEIQEALELLQKKNYQNDKRVAENTVRALCNKKLYGPSRIKALLYEKLGENSASELFESTLESLIDEGEISFDESAKKLAQKYEGRERAYIYAKLRNYGFSDRQAQNALKDIR